MSTKTTFKRVALVAVAALGLSLVAVAPSNAVNLDVPVYEEAAFRTGSFVTAPATATVGTPVSAILKMSASCLLQGNVAYNNKPTGDLGYFVINASFTTQIDVAPVGTNLVTNSVDTVGTVPTGYTNSNANTVRWAASEDNGYKNSLQGACIANTAPLTAYGSVTFTPDVAGTYVIVVLPKGATTGAVTWTVTAAAKAAANSTSATSVASLANAGGGDDTDGVYGPMAANAANIASILVTASNGSTTAPLLNSDALAKSATISGPGLLSWDGGITKGRAVTSLKGTLAQTLLVYGDGTAGKATITITDGGFTVTETITFYGSVATVTLKANETVLPLAVQPSTTNNDMQNGASAATITVADANGNPVPGQNVYLVSSDRAVYDLNYALAGATDATGSITVNMYAGATAGSFTVTATTNASSTATTGKTASAVSFRVSDGKPTLVKLTVNGSSATEFPKASRVYSVWTLSNAAGTMPAGCYKVATNPTTLNADNNYNAIHYGVSGVYTGQSGDTICVGKDGMSRYNDYAYYLAESSGPAVRVTGGTAGITFDIATITVTGDAAVAAAADAAAEATDAANAATDAANAAAEAADAATAAAQDAADAVAALSTQVAEMIDALKKQITALTNLVIKIQKKVKA